MSAEHLTDNLHIHGIHSLGTSFQPESNHIVFLNTRFGIALVKKVLVNTVFLLDEAETTTLIVEVDPADGLTCFFFLLTTRDGNFNVLNCDFIFRGARGRSFTITPFAST